MIRQKTNQFLLAALAFLFVLCNVFTSGQNIAYAESGVTYSGVLDDLKKDSSFDERIRYNIFRKLKKRSGKSIDMFRKLW